MCMYVCSSFTLRMIHKIIYYMRVNYCNTLLNRYRILSIDDLFFLRF